MPSTNTNLLLSLDAYEDTSKVTSGWTRIDFTDRSSGLFAAAYQKGNEIVIAFRGWDQLDPQDAPDIYRAYANLPFEQIGDAQDFVDDILAAHPAASITLTGHSLGGALAAIMAVRNDLVAETFAGIESVGAAYKSMNGYDYPVSGLELWDIPDADHNQGITQAALRDYAGVTNHVMFGDIATYNDRTVALLNHIGVDSVYGGAIQNGILDDDSRFGRYINATGTAFTTIVPSQVEGAPYSESFSTALHALGMHALQIVFRTQMNALWVSEQRLAYQLTNDLLATEANGDGPYRMTFDGLDKIMFDHLNAPAVQHTVAEAMVRDWQDIAAAGDGSVSNANADMNTALLQLSIQFAAAQSLGDDSPGATGGLIRVFDDYLQTGLDGSRAWGGAIDPEGAHLIRNYAEYLLGAADAGGTIGGARYLLTEAADGNGATISSTTETADLIFGGAGSDLAQGGRGNDVIFGLDGRDTINGGFGADILSGSTKVDQLFGDGGNDLLIGGFGNDRLSGGGGNDTFVFTTLSNGANGDTLTDFLPGFDEIALEQAKFANIGGKGSLVDEAFHEGAAAADVQHRIIYDAATGALFFDADGSNADLAIRIATLSPGLSLSASDFSII